MQGWKAGIPCPCNSNRGVRLTTPKRLVRPDRRSNKRGDGPDRKRWDEMCAECHKTVPMTQERLKKIADEMWTAAQIEIRKELENPTLKRMILIRAEEIKPLLFPWLPVDNRP